MNSNQSMFVVAWVNVQSRQVVNDKSTFDKAQPQPKTDVEHQNENANPNVLKYKPCIQNVWTKSQRLKVLKWMNTTVCERGHNMHIMFEALKEFPAIFRSPSVNQQVWPLVETPSSYYCIC